MNQSNRKKKLGTLLPVRGRPGRGTGAYLRREFVGLRFVRGSPSAPCATCAAPSLDNFMQRTGVPIGRGCPTTWTSGTRLFHDRPTLYTGSTACSLKPRPAVHARPGRQLRSLAIPHSSFCFTRARTWQRREKSSVRLSHISPIFTWWARQGSNLQPPA